MPGGRLAKQPGFPNRKRRVKLCPCSILQRGQAAILEPGGAPECPPACERPRGGPSFGPLFFGEDLGQSQAIPLISLERGRPGSVPVPGGNKGMDRAKRREGPKRRSLQPSKRPAGGWTALIGRSAAPVRGCPFLVTTRVEGGRLGERSDYDRFGPPGADLSTHPLGWAPDSRGD